jgi:hypothetical protein
VIGGRDSVVSAIVGLDIAETVGRADCRVAVMLLLRSGSEVCHAGDGGR